MPLPGPSLTLSPDLLLGPGDTPASGLFTEGFLASTSPWNDPEGHWAALCAALAAMAEPIAELVMDVGSPDDPANYTAGWSVLLDPSQCPAQYLPYCGMFVGVFVAPDTPEDEARAVISARSGWMRGTPAGIVATAQRFLTGTQSCALLERQSPTGADAYAFLLVVRPEQVPNVAALTAAVDSVKPAGVVWTLILSDGWVIGQLENASATIGALEAAFSTVNGAEQDLPGH